MKTKVKTLATAALLAFGLFSGAAHATPPAGNGPPVGTDCNLSTLSPTYVACSGSFSGNLGDSLTAAQVTQVSNLFTAGGFAYDPAMIYAKSTIASNGVFSDDALDMSINFVNPVGGAFVIGLKQATYYSFYLMNGGTTGISTINFNTLGVTNAGNGAGLSHAVFIGTVPEPETYALMLAGLGLVGFMARRRKAK